MIDQYKTVLADMIAIPSISTDASYGGSIGRIVTYLTKLFEQHDFAVQVVKGAASNPLVVARLDVGAPTTTLVYGHYDVQPAAEDQGWSSQPFELTERDGRLFGRGVADNKGQTLIHMVTVFALAKQRALHHNVVFVLEGNEESLNPDLPTILRDQSELFACDTVLISDGEITGDSPTLDASLRGGFNVRLTLTTARSDLHSGLAGGAVPSASTELIRLLGSLTHPDGSVAVPGFYDGMDAIPLAVQQANQELADSQNLTKLLGVKRLAPANKVDFFTQTGLYPTIQISGMRSGYTGAGFANIVPASAEARLNVRLVASQNPELISKQIVQYLKRQAGPDVDLEVEAESLHDPVKIKVDTPLAQSVRAMLKQAFGREVVVRYVGGAIPIVTDFQSTLRKPVLLVSLANDDCNMHGADENLRLDVIEKGLKFSHQFFSSPTA